MNKKKCPQRKLSNGHKQANLPSRKKKKTTSKWLTTNVQKMFKLSGKELQVKPTKQYGFRQSC